MKILFLLAITSPFPSICSIGKLYVLTRHNSCTYIILAFFYLSFPGFVQNLHAQNLIYNGDFELYDTCPTSVSSPGDYQIEHCIGWSSPTYATSDYFNSCAAWPVSVPNNAMGNRTPFSGNAYCGVLIEYCFNPNGTCTYGWWVEYIQSELTQSLKQGYEYEFSCYISLSNIWYQYAFSEFGVLFTPTAINKTNGKPFEEVPQVLNDSPNFLTDTNWIQIKQRFIAQGGEKYVTIGFFIDTLAPDTLITDPFFDPNNYGSYYFIDSCSLIETGNVFYHPNVFTPNNDGINDYWTPFTLDEDEIIHIYNRWGNLIYTVDFENRIWDGNTSNGKMCVDGVYYFISTENRKGIIQLVR